MAKGSDAAKTTPLSSQYLYLSNLAVQSDYRHQGIACKLLRECDRVASQWGFKSICLHVGENNTAARQLYEQVGYRFKKVDFNLGTLILGQPRTLFLEKHLLEERW
ncbi:MAG: GNAT family N-acetyltransferase [Merismopedia sp. SIO2A8]|nr:GNAT family N-acetyltransferase [Merismopedia sp. SIO2A8]